MTDTKEGEVILKLVECHYEKQNDIICKGWMVSTFKHKLSWPNGVNLLHNETYGAYNEFF